MKMWPYNPGADGELGGRIRRRLLYMRQVVECIKYLRDVYILSFADTLYTLQLDAYTVVAFSAL